MAYTQLYIHCVWATWHRLPLIMPSLEPPLYTNLAAKCHNLGCTMIAIGGMPDHIHILIGLIPTCSISRLIGEMKGASSHLITHQLQPGMFFKWQRAYGVFSVSPHAIPDVKHYIHNQKIHHGSCSCLPDLEPPFDTT